MYFFSSSSMRCRLFDRSERVFGWDSAIAKVWREKWVWFGLQMPTTARQLPGANCGRQVLMNCAKMPDQVSNLE
jgi:hypothetical protein